MNSQKFAYSRMRKAIAAVVIVSLTAISEPISIAAPLFRETPGQLLYLLRHLNAWTSILSTARPISPPVDKRTRKTSKASPALSRAEREAEVVDIRMNCSDCTKIRSQEPLQFIGVPVDSSGDAINGLGVKWLSSNSEVLEIDNEGRANPGKPGKVTVSASTQNRTKSIEMTVLKTRKKRTSSRNSNRSAESPSSHHSGAPASWNVPVSEVDDIYRTENIVGDPPGRLKPIGAAESSALGTKETGVSNFNFSREVVTLPGRGGLDATLSLVLNSQVWTKIFNFTGNPIHLYNSGWPGPGFSLGYGRIQRLGGGLTPLHMALTDPDGTRHALNETTTNNYDSSDGSFLHYTEVTGGGTLYYPDGTQVTYGAAGGGTQSYPTRITDRNGNYISIAYKDGVGPKIDTIKDTLERYIRFFYASNGDLVTIKAPGLTTGSERQVMRFYYEQVSLTTADLFDTNVGRPSSARVVEYIFLPSSSDDGADTGFRFDYSIYGMVHTVKEFRGMTVSGESLTETGSVTSDGSEAAATAYNYPTTASDLVDPPRYTERSDDWAGRTSGGSAPIHKFSVTENGLDVVATVETPGGTITETHAMVDQGSWADGLVTKILVQYKPTPTASPVVVSETQYNWEENPTNSTGRIKDVRITNDASPRQTRSTIYSYDDANTPYNNVSVASETDFTTDGSLGTVLRRTETTYVTSSSYLNRRLYHLPAQTRIYAGNSSTPISRTDYAYDQNSLTTRSGILMFDSAFDPSSGSYVSANAYRGNLTTVTTYPDATTTANAINRGSTYDIAGNLVTAQLDCCQVKSFTYTSTNQYAYPISETSGNPGGPQLTTSTSYDYNTGLVIQETDANTQTTSFTYEPVSLRLAQIDKPGGGQTIYDYSDALVADSAGRKHTLVTQSIKLDSTRFASTRSYFDGRGSLTQTFSDYTASNGWSVLDVEYDSMGRFHRSGNPYYCTSDYGVCSINAANLWTTSTYDHLGRVTQVTRPRGDDANPSLTVSVQASYVGNTTTITDAAGSQRRQKTDALGRIIRLDEPDSSGNLGSETSPNQSTSYGYDVLDNRVRVTQGSQNRYFKYDSLSRLIRELQVEQVANSSYNLTDSLTGNSSWTRKLEYNPAGLPTHAYDARGVQTDFYYDGLNRVTLIDHSDSTPDVRYFYDSQTLPSGAPNFTRGSSNGRVVAMTYGTASSVTGTYFGYDVMGRVSVQKQVTGTNTYSLAYTYNLAGLLATQAYPSGRVLTHSYDDAGRLSQISDATTTYASSFSYAATRGLLSETWGNGAVHSIAYNNALQVSQIKLKQSSSGSELQRYDYLYGQVTQSNGSVDKSKNRGQIARVDAVINGSTTKEWEQRFSYDELGRLAAAAEYQQGTGGTPTWRQQFTYDRYGNRFQSGSTNSGMTYIPVVSTDITAGTNRFISTGSTPITYDAAGNITQDTKFRSMNYTYDAKGRQISASAIGGSPSQTSVYDCVGQRVQTTSGGVSRTMVYDVFGQQIADYNGSTVERENIYRGRQLLAVQQLSGGLSYVLTDAQGSTRALMNNSGSGTSVIISRRDYLPFGEEIGAGVGLRTTTQKYSQSDNVRRRFAMTERDDVSGLDHTWFRKVESRAGRWTSPDPYNGSQRIGNPQSMNRYSYVGNDPVNFVDPSGLEQCYSWVLITVLREPGKPDVELSRQVLSTFCVGTTLRPDRIFGENRWDGRKITRTDRRLEPATPEAIAALKQKQQAEYDRKKRDYENCKKQAEEIFTMLTAFNNQAQKDNETHPAAVGALLGSLLMGDVGGTILSIATVGFYHGMFNKGLESERKAQLATCEKLNPGPGTVTRTHSTFSPRR
jgi:RHS repeat-associated protein